MCISSPTGGVSGVVFGGDELWLFCLRWLFINNDFFFLSVYLIIHLPTPRALTHQHLKPEAINTHQSYRWSGAKINSPALGVNL